MVFHRRVGSAKSRVVLFGGQGSSTVFSPSTLSAAKDDVHTSPAGLVLLSLCHAALIEEYQSLDQSTKDRLRIDISKFRGPEDLLVPDPSLQTHGLIQLVVITLLQLLRYVKETERCGQGFNTYSEEIIETTGFCSGILSASVVASSPTLNQYTAFAVEAFRLAFWIGCRTFLKSQEIDPTHRQKASWSLVVMGSTLTTIQEELRDYHTKSNSQFVRVSAISSATIISLTGPKPHLEEFKQRLGSASITKFADIQSWYHGGEHLQSTLNKVLTDIERRNIKFPKFKDLITSVRSSSSGLIVSSEDQDSWSYAELVTRHILIDPVDWIKTSQSISSAVEQSLKHDIDLQAEIISFGPSSDSLFAELKSRNQYPAVEFRDRSAFSHGGFTTGRRESIAIVGMGVNFPKGKDRDQLWETLSSGLNVISEIPSDRFDVSHYCGPTGIDKNRIMDVSKGAFLDDVWKFDNSFFNISPREAQSMDPQQRIILTTTQAALEDAGYVADATPSFRRSSIGCYVGIATSDYVDNLRNNIDVYYSPGTLRAFHSGRLSYMYKLSGPSMTIDTACSSSTVSIYQACRALQAGDCTTAIAGGANVISSPDMYLGLDRGHFLSHTNGCKPFDKDVDGYGRAEGCGMFVLKRLSDAISEDDRIHGVIKGIEVNQSGKSHSITHPHSETQAELLRLLLRNSNVDPASLDVVEAHGTGTQAGDTREISALRLVFEDLHSVSNPLIVSSVKGSIGHCEAASGAAGLAKLLLMLRKNEIPMQANLKELNPQLGDLVNGNLIVPRKPIPWKSRESRPRRALLNNFGAAGSNAALVLEEKVEPNSSNIELADRASYLFNLSAKSTEALALSLHNHRRFLEREPLDSRLRDICYTATARRQSYSYGVSIECSSREDLQTKLANVDITDSKIVSKSQPIIFVFSGQGSLHHGMGKDLMKTSSSFRSSIMHCNTILKGAGFEGILEYIAGDALPQSVSAVDHITVSQCACVALEYSMAQLLMSLNIVPDYVTGHSLGEYAALIISGALALEDALSVVANRARLMIEHCALDLSGMVACKFSSSKADALIAGDVLFSGLNVACINSENACVISGPLSQLAAFQKTCLSQGHKTQRLDVPYGFHSKAMDPIIKPLNDLGSSVLWSSPSIPVASNVFGRFFDPEDFGPDYFARHAREPVRFLDIIEHLRIKGALGESVCIEVGPHPTTLPMMQNMVGSLCHSFPSMQKGGDPWHSLYAILSYLFKNQDKIAWRQVYEPNMKIVDLPGHPLAGTPFVVPYKEHSSSELSCEKTSTAYVKTGFTLLPRQLASSSSSEQTSFIFETDMAILGPHIAGHNVGGTAICPASVLFELVIEAARAAVPNCTDLLLVGQDMSFSNPLILDHNNNSQIVRVLLTGPRPQPGIPADLKVAIKLFQNEKETECCCVTISMRDPSEVRQGLRKDTALVKRQQRHLATGHKSHNTFQRKLLYKRIFTRVVTYSAEYQSLTEFSLSDSNDEGIGSFKLPPTSREDACLIPPVFTDTLLHAAGFAANLSVASDEICICSHVGLVEVLDGINFTNDFTVYCNLFDNSDGVIVADTIALDLNGEAVAAVRGIEFKKIRLVSFQKLIQKASTRSTKSTDHSEKAFLPSSGLGTGNLDSATASLVTSPSAVDTRAEVRDTIRDIIGEVYGSHKIDLTESMTALGIDSLMRIEITSKLKDYFPASNISSNDLLECESLETLENYVVLALNSLVSTPDSTQSEPMTLDLGQLPPNGKKNSRPRARDIMTDVIGEIYGSHDLDYFKSLDSLGIDSLMQIEIVSKLKEILPEADFDGSDLLQSETLKDIENLLEYKMQPRQKYGSIIRYHTPPQLPYHTDVQTMQMSFYDTGARVSSTNPLLLHASANTNLPLYLIHDGSGQVGMYAKVYQPDRNVWAYFDPDFRVKSLEITCLEDMAARYVYSLSSSRVHDLIIGGWSFGGVVAFQVAQYLVKAGVRVKGVILIDSPYPRKHAPLPEQVVTHILSATGSSSKAGTADLVAEFKRNAKLLAEYNPRDHDAVRDVSIKTVYLQSQDTLDTEAACGVQYEWLSNQTARDLAVQGWEALVGGRIKVLPLNGNHFQPFTPKNIVSTSKQLKAACRYIEALDQT